MVTHMRKIALAFAFAGALAQQAWASQIVIEGDASAVKVMTENASTEEVVKQIAERFGIEIVGGVVAGGSLNGQYEGTLAQVLKSILPANGYVMAYRDDKPSRVTFTGANSSQVSSLPVAPTPPPTAAPAANGTEKIETGPQTIEQRLRTQALGNQAPAPAAPTGQTDQAQQMKQMTAQALTELEALVRGIKTTVPQ